MAIKKEKYNYIACDLIDNKKDADQILNDYRNTINELPDNTKKLIRAVDKASNYSISAYDIFVAANNSQCYVKPHLENLGSNMLQIFDAQDGKNKKTMKEFLEASVNVLWGSYQIESSSLRDSYLYSYLEKKTIHNYRVYERMLEQADEIVEVLTDTYVAWVLCKSVNMDYENFVLDAHEELFA